MFREGTTQAENAAMTQHPPDPTMPVGPPRRIAMLIYPGVAPLDVSGPLQVFGVANFLKKQKVYDVITVAPTAAPVPTQLGFAFLPRLRDGGTAASCRYAPGVRRRWS